MFAVIKRNPLAAGLAIALHLALVALLIFGVDWWREPVRPKPPANLVQAQAVDARQLEAEVEKQKQLEAKEQADKEAALKREQERLEEVKRQQAAEKQRLQELETRRLEAEKRRKAEATKRKAEEEKKRKAEEARRKAEEEKKRQEAEARRKAEAEKKRKAAEAARLAAEQKAREDALRAQVEAEQNALEIERYVGAIKRQVERSWIKPPSARGQLRCTLSVRIIPGGDVVPGSVRVIESSGDSAFDRSVETAVYRASPLPVPSGNLFESFRDVTLVFDPSK